MTIGQKLLRVFHPFDENQRMEFRHELQRATAEIDDLCRDLNGHMKSQDSQIRICRILAKVKDKV